MKEKMSYKKWAREKMSYKSKFASKISFNFIKNEDCYILRLWHGIS